LYIAFLPIPFSVSVLRPVSSTQISGSAFVSDIGLSSRGVMHTLWKDSNQRAGTWLKLRKVG
jgi:hypothetical protein